MGISDERSAALQAKIAAKVARQSATRLSWEDWFRVDSARQRTLWAESRRGDWMMWVLWRSSGEWGSEPRRRLVLAAAECAELSLPLLSSKYAGGAQRCLEAARQWAGSPSQPNIEALAEAATPLIQEANRLGRESVDSQCLSAVASAATNALKDPDDDEGLYTIAFTNSAQWYASVNAVCAKPGCPGWLALSFSPAKDVAGSALYRALNGGTYEDPEEELGHDVIWKAPYNPPDLDRLLFPPCREVLAGCASVIRKHYPEPAGARSGVKRGGLWSRLLGGS